LDYVLCSTALASRAVSCDAEREFGGSDHAPVTAVFDYRAPIAAPGEGEPRPPARAGQLTLF
jgi:hypothetical protein